MKPWSVFKELKINPQVAISVASVCFLSGNWVTNHSFTFLVIPRAYSWLTAWIKCREVSRIDSVNLIQYLLTHSRGWRLLSWPSWHWRSVRSFSRLERPRRRRSLIPEIAPAASWCPGTCLAVLLGWPGLWAAVPFPLPFPESTSTEFHWRVRTRHN